MTTSASQKAVGTKDQYSLIKILGIWAAVALPMALLGWVVHRRWRPNRVHLGQESSE